MASCCCGCSWSRYQRYTSSSQHTITLHITDGRTGSGSSSTLAALTPTSSRCSGSSSTSTGSGEACSGHRLPDGVVGSCVHAWRICAHTALTVLCLHVHLRSLYQLFQRSPLNRIALQLHCCGVSGRTDNAVKNHWNSTLKRRRADYAPGGPLDVSAVTAALQRRLATAGADGEGQQRNTCSSSELVPPALSCTGSEWCPLAAGFVRFTAYPCTCSFSNLSKQLATQKHAATSWADGCVWLCGCLERNLSSCRTHNAAPSTLTWLAPRCLQSCCFPACCLPFVSFRGWRRRATAAAAAV